MFLWTCTFVFWSVPLCVHGASLCVGFVGFPRGYWRHLPVLSTETNLFPFFHPPFTLPQLSAGCQLWFSLSGVNEIQWIFPAVNRWHTKTKIQTGNTFTLLLQLLLISVVVYMLAHSYVWSHFSLLNWRQWLRGLGQVINKLWPAFLPHANTHRLRRVINNSECSSACLYIHCPGCSQLHHGGYCNSPEFRQGDILCVRVSSTLSSCAMLSV